uniref:Protein kinase domain-containing protein n=1 Tax=Arcella intermedia TaxID=1963864 RepID=A0A6B2LC05_9EUKA
MSTFHENLIHLWGKDCFVDSSNCVWIPMEYMNGGSLQDSIRIVRQSKYGKDTIGNPLGIPEVLSLNELQIGWIISNVCKGLNYLHKLNRIHRDITSSNILLSKDARQVKIADFGFVLQIQEEEKRRSTCGTYEWMAPEILNSLPYSYSADIWSLGVVLYECAEAQTPYHGLTEIKILRQMKKGPPKLPKNKWSRDMLNFFSQCTQLSPKKRSTISQLIAHPWMTSLISDPELFNSDAFFNELSVIIHYAKADVKRRMAPYSPRK